MPGTMKPKVMWISFIRSLVLGVILGITLVSFHDVTRLFAKLIGPGMTEYFAVQALPANSVDELPRHWELITTIRRSSRVLSMNTPMEEVPVPEWLGSGWYFYKGCDESSLGWHTMTIPGSAVGCHHVTFRSIGSDIFLVSVYTSI